MFKELRGATRGTDYFYVESNSELLPVGLLGEERFVEKWGGSRKEYEIRVDLAKISERNIYNFGFTRSGHFWEPSPPIDCSGKYLLIVPNSRYG